MTAYGRRQHTQHSNAALFPPCTCQSGQLWARDRFVIFSFVLGCSVQVAEENKMNSLIRAAEQQDGKRSGPISSSSSCSNDTSAAAVVAPLQVLSPPRPPPPPPTPTTPTTPPRLPLLQAAALKFHLNFSRAQYDGLRRVLGFKDLLPPHYLVQQTVDEAAAPTTIIPADNGMSIAMVSLRESILSDFIFNPALNHQQRHVIKIGGDAATDHKEKDEMARSVTPSLSIEPCHCPMERLHCQLRITEIYERVVADHLMLSTAVSAKGKSGAVRKAVVRARLDLRYRSTLKALGIHRSITGLTGNECRRILDAPDTYTRDIRSHPRHAEILRSMKLFAKLDKMVSSISTDEDAAAFGKLAHNWARHLTAWLPKAGNSIYVHVFAVHAWRWRNLGQSSTYALEKTNAMVKGAKLRTRQDLKDRSGSSLFKSASGQLAAMISHVNRGNTLSFQSPVTPPKKRQYSCSKCSGSHYSTYSLCPIRSMPPLDAATLSYPLIGSIGKKHARDQERKHSITNYSFCKKLSY